MAKKKIAYLSVIAFAAIGFIIYLLIAKRIIILDNTAEMKGEYLYRKNARYVPCCGSYTEGGTIAKTKDGYRVNAVKEDSTNTFIVTRSVLDQQLLVREDYDIPRNYSNSRKCCFGFFI